MTTLAKRLREARLKTGLSQYALGIEANMEEASASARMNQYEQGVHAPDWLTVQALAAALKVPTAYFYAEDDCAAELLIAFYALPLDAREAVVEYVKRPR